MFYPTKGNPADREFFKQALQRFHRMFDRVTALDNVILFDRNLGYQNDANFVRALGNAARTPQEQTLELRLNTLVWAATHALHVAGDFVECGVYQGFCSAFLVDYLDFSAVQKIYYLYDTFAGIPEEFDSESKNAPLLAEPGIYESVRDRFAAYPNVHVVKGVVPDTLHQTGPEKIAFLHLDMNSSKSEIAALEVLFERVSPGGIIVFDDYGWTFYKAQQVAEDKFMQERGYRILELPTGQGLLFKR
jgi:O-methyltransferase